MLRPLGLRHRIMGILAGGAFIAAGIVGLCLNELSALREHSEGERIAEQRRETIHEAVVVALRTAVSFGSLGLDLNPAEQKRAIADGEATLARFEALQERIAPVLRDVLSAEDRATLAQSVVAIRRLWPEIQDEIAQGERDEFLFHLFALAKHAEGVHELMFKADAAAKVRASVAAEAVAGRTRQAGYTIVIALFAGVVVLLGVGWLMLHFGVKRPLGEAIAAVERIAGGDVASPVPVPSGSDEIGAILSALRIFRDNALARLELERERARDISERDARREQLEQIIAEFRAAVLAALSEGADAFKAMDSATQALAAAAADTHVGAGKAAAASCEVSTNVAGIASATVELSASFESMKSAVERAEGAIEQAASQANVTSSAIDGLSQTAQTIGDVASFIESVASQTNLLALNATIEAARAGAAGRGFAVVATEVKSLAAQTATATGDISARIDEVRRRTAEVVEAIRVIARTNGEATTHASTIATAVGEQNQVTISISRSIQDAANWAAGLSGIVNDLAAAVGRTRSAAGDVQVALNASAASAQKFSSLVDDFLGRVRAA